jgi:hypothetical protein
MHPIIKLVFLSIQSRKRTRSIFSPNEKAKKRRWREKRERKREKRERAETHDRLCSLTPLILPLWTGMTIKIFLPRDVYTPPSLPLPSLPLPLLPLPLPLLLLHPHGRDGGWSPVRKSLQQSVLLNFVALFFSLSSALVRSLSLSLSLHLSLSFSAPPLLSLVCVCLSWRKFSLTKLVRLTRFVHGAGSGASAILAQAQAGLWEVAIVCGLGVTIAIMTSASISGAHLNPAMSFAFALVRPSSFPVYKFAPYCFSQFLGLFYPSSPLSLSLFLSLSLSSSIAAFLSYLHFFLRYIFSSALLTGMLYIEYFRGISRWIGELWGMGRCHLAIH